MGPDTPAVPDRRAASRPGQTPFRFGEPGATGMIGMDAMTKAAPDGYTMGILFLPHTVLPELFGKMPYDTARDLTPIANVAWLYNVLVVPAASPIKSLRDWMDRAKAQPGKLAYGSGGIGSPAHLLGESFIKACRSRCCTCRSRPCRGCTRAAGWPGRCYVRHLHRSRFRWRVAARSSHSQ